jgi:hypothetical protein
VAELLIPIPDIVRETGNARFRAKLDGVDFNVRLLWNSRAETWSLDLYDVDLEPIATGIALVPWWPILDLLTDDRRPPGELMLYNADRSTTNPTLADLGIRSRLVYYEAET